MLLLYVPSSFLPCVVCGFSTFSSTRDDPDEGKSEKMLRGPGVRRLVSNGNGWSSIQVFNGDNSFLDHDIEVRKHQQDGIEWFSQWRQDEVIMTLMNNMRNGYFIDLAANEAVGHSNTFALEQSFDWNGLCIEAQPKYWHKLSHRKCQVVGAVVGNERNKGVEFVLANGSGEIYGMGKQKPSDKKPLITLHMVPLLEILQRNEAPKVIDYLSLDVEGAEEIVMQDFPFLEYMIKVMTVERPSRRLQGILVFNGYVHLAELSREKAGEQLFVHESVLPDFNIEGAKAKLHEKGSWALQTAK